MVEQKRERSPESDRGAEEVSCEVKKTVKRCILSPTAGK